MSDNKPDVKRWHPQAAEYESSTLRGSTMYAIYAFPCCGRKVGVEEDVPHDAPSQYEHEGCEDVPT
ncbi:MAG: hypothetical protein EPO32_03525 [Anaerolineae bacterium]|nr:MAG: hypothetical protein EPO32_03525 [Anaerolineae bacterium]